ncbi:MAG: LPS export ABC transporter periplasmic protein LptC [Caedimonas sp.]|nr:LPS export ABC transporter periplasmic protein LptC [Caedimonas sp.]
MKAGFPRPFLINAAQHQYNVTHTQRVQMLRKLFPLMASAMFMLIIFWPEIRSLLEKSHVSDTNFKKFIYARNRLNAPRLHSTDEKGRPYYISAKSAIQKSEKIADLEAPRSKMRMEDGTDLEIKANTGLYNDLTKILDYKNNVRLRSDTGYKLKTSLAHANLEKKQAFGDRHVEGEGPAGKVWAEGFHATQNGVIHFKGKSCLIIHQDKQAVPKEKS